MLTLTYNRIIFNFRAWLVVFNVVQKCSTKLVISTYLRVQFVIVHKKGLTTVTWIHMGSYFQILGVSR